MFLKRFKAISRTTEELIKDIGVYDHRVCEENTKHFVTIYKYDMVKSKLY